MVELIDTTVHFGRHCVLDRLSFHVPSNGLVCLVGPSGCGKSTILNAIAGLVPYRGEVRVSSSRVGYAFQEDRLIPWRTVEENLHFALLDLLGPVPARSAARLWLERLGLAPVAAQLPVVLSGGMRRRLNLARALAIRPDILLLDEPFAFLDAAMVGTVRDAILEVAREAGTTTIMVTHVPEQVRDMKPRTYTIAATPIAELIDQHDSATRTTIPNNGKKKDVTDEHGQI